MKCSKRTAISACLALSSVLVCSLSEARTTSRNEERIVGRPQITIDLESDIQITTTALLLAFAPRFTTLRSRPMPVALSPAGLNSWDRSVIGNNSATARSLSDVLLWTNAILPFALSGLDALESGDRAAAAHDAMVLSQTLVVNGMVNTIFKHAVRRARPYTYDPATTTADRNASNATLSFFSGHTSTSFAMATAYSVLFTQRNAKSPLIAPVWIGTHALAATTGIMRVMAGKHFWTDVLAGAAIGSGIGLLIPYLHKMTGTKRDSSSLLSRLRLTPSFYEGGFGANVMIIL